MPGPEEPTWDLPELSGADPASLDLPEPEPEAIYDTGSDAWWRQQAAAQRAAAERDPEPPVITPQTAPLMPPLELVEPEVLNTVIDPVNLPTGPSPFEEAYLPAEEVWPAVEPELPPRPVLRPLVVPEPAPVYDEAPGAPGYPPAWADEPEVAAAPASFLDQGPAEPEFRDDILPDHSGGRERVGFAKAMAWAGLALAGVGLVVVAFLLLGQDEPQGTPVVTAPSVVPSAVAPTEPAATIAPTAEPTAAPSPTAAPAAAAPIVPLTVLNNSRITGLAKTAAAKFRAGGWPVPATGNYRGQIDTTTIYYPAGQQASAERFGKQFGVRVLPRFATLPGSGMTVVVTRDFA